MIKDKYIIVQPKEGGLPIWRVCSISHYDNGNIKVYRILHELPDEEVAIGVVEGTVRKERVLEGMKRVHIRP